jgi:hypothetical protein
MRDMVSVKYLSAYVKKKVYKQYRTLENNTKKIKYALFFIVVTKQYIYERQKPTVYKVKLHLSVCPAPKKVTK